MDGVGRKEWTSSIAVVEGRLGGMEELIESSSSGMKRCKKETKRLDSSVVKLQEELGKVHRRLEKSEKEARKYFLLFTKVRRTRRLERPGHIIALVNRFLTDNLKVEDVEVEEAYRVEGDSRPQDIRVKFASMKDRNTVLAAGRRFK